METRAMKQKMFAAVAAVLVTASVGCGFSFAEDAPKPADRAAGEWSVAPLLPPDTLAMITVKDASKLTDKFKLTTLWQIYSHPAIQKAFRTKIGAAQMGLAVVEMQAHLKVSEILSMFNQGEITFAFVGADQVGDNGQPIPDLLLSLQARDKTQAVLDELSKLTDQVNAQAGNQLQITEMPVGDYTVHRVGVPNTTIAASYAVCDGNVIVTLGDGLIEKVVAMHEKLKRNDLKPEAKPAEALLQNPAFANIAKKAGPDGDISVFVNWQELRKNPNLKVFPKTENDKTGWAVIGLESVRSFGYSASVIGTGMREVFLIDSPVAQRSGLLKVFPVNEGLQFDALSAAPENSVFAVAVKAAPDKLLEKFMDFAAVIKPEAKDQIDQALNAAAQNAKIDIRKDVFAALSGEAVFAVAMNNPNPKLPISFPQMVLSLTIKDIEKLNRTLTAVRAATLENFDYNEQEEDGKSIVTAREKFPQGHDPRQLSYAINGKDLLLSLYPLALHEEIQRREARAKDPKAAASNPMLAALTDDVDFKNTASNVSGTPAIFAYADTVAIGTALYEALIPVAQMKAHTEIDARDLPAARELIQNASSAVLGFSADHDGIVASGFGPGPIVSFTTLALVDAAAKARNAAAGHADVDQRKHGVLDQVGESLQSYAKENNGNYPAALKDLQPKYLADLTKELEFVKFVGKQDKPNKIVAYSSEKLPGPISALLQSGEVVEIRRDQLGKVLKDGVSAEAQAASTEAARNNGTKGHAPDF